ncbi:hypothetical protein AB6M11_000540 [Listeria monocytogenes]|nr:hypothetical protein [Listeria monocytogenes]EAG2314631.1 hypothetical protein [Listeria monocytogenes]
MKKLLLSASLLIIFSFGLTACGNSTYNEKEESNEESEQTNDLVSTKNYNINEINENEETQGKHLEVVVKNKISKKQSDEIVNKVIDKYKSKVDALYVNMHYTEGAYSAILNARHSYNKNGVKITGLKVGETEIEMNKNFNKDR